MASKTKTSRKPAARKTAAKTPVKAAETPALSLAQDPVAVPYTNPDPHGYLGGAAEKSVLNAPRIGNMKNLGDLMMSVIAPEVYEDMGRAPWAWEPPEATALRMLAFELDALAYWVDAGNAKHIEFPCLLRRLGERATATCDLAERIRSARFGESATYGGVATPEKGAAT
jgi:hypothetical protein